MDRGQDVLWRLQRANRALLLGCFVLLVGVRLTISYGRYVVLPIIGADEFALLSAACHSLFPFVATAFAVSLVAAVVLKLRATRSQATADAK